MDYFELAEKQFRELQNKVLDEDRCAIGAESTEEYDIDGVKFTIKVILNDK